MKKEGFHHYSIINLDDEILEMVRRSAPDIYKSKVDSKRAQEKECAMFLKNGYKPSFSGGIYKFSKDTRTQ